MNLSSMQRLILAAPLVLVLLAATDPPQEADRTGAAPVPQLRYGPLDLGGYEYAEVILDPPHRVRQSDGRSILHHHGFQITVHATAFPVRALDPVLHVGRVVLVHYTADRGSTPQALTYTFYDPALARAEHPLEIIYGDDERTRSRFAEPLDPERLLRLPDERRAEHHLAPLEFATLLEIGSGGKVSGRAHLADGLVLHLGVIRADGLLRVLESIVAPDAGGRFQAEILPSLVRDAKQVLLLAASKQARTRPPDRAVVPGKLPAGWEILDHKPIPTGG